MALDLGINFIDTSPFYGRGMSEVLLGIALRDVPRDSYLLGTKLGRYSLTHFDFSARRVDESVHVSLHRLGTDHLDILLLHDVEFVELPQIWEETIPAALALKEKGLVEDLEPDEVIEPDTDIRAAGTDQPTIDLSRLATASTGFL